MAAQRESAIAPSWSPWVPHLSGWPDAATPNDPGVYRIGRAGQGCLDYVGQTGMGGMALRKRLAMRRVVCDAEMPCTDPHTAAALRAIRRSTGAEFEASVAVVHRTVQWRKGVEAPAVALHRRESQRSPTVNFGRLPAGYRKSSPGDYSGPKRSMGRVLLNGPSVAAALSWTTSSPSDRSPAACRVTSPRTRSRGWWCWSETPSPFSTAILASRAGRRR